MSLRTLHEQAVDAQVQFYEGKGVKLNAAPTKVSRPPTAAFIDAKRGKIKGWSRHSRRRMRNVLLTLRPPQDWKVYGCTFTIPGPVQPPEVAREIWKRYCRGYGRLPVAMIWRLEVQKRGQAHWHAVMFSAPEDDLRFSKKFGSRVILGVHHPMMRAGVGRWLDAVDSAIGELHYKRDDGTMFKGLPSELPGATRHAVDMQSEDYGHATGSWLRYLQDHASKTKVAQMAEGFGRHWGIVGRKHLSQVLPDDVVNMDRKEYARFLRAFCRLCTPFGKADCVFGTRSYPARFGRFGSTVKFSKPETVKRIVEWAKN